MIGTILLSSSLLWIPISLILGYFIHPYLIGLMMLSVIQIYVTAYAQVNGWLRL